MSAGAHRAPVRAPAVPSCRGPWASDGSKLAIDSHVTRTSLCLLTVTAAAAGCGGGNDPLALDASDGSHGHDAGSPDDATPHPDAEIADPDAAVPDYLYSDLDVGCAPIFAQSNVPEYRLTIAPDHWATMQDEFYNPVLSDSMTLVDPPYHPVQVHIVEGGNQHEPADVMIRLNGNTSWLQTIVFDTNPKMQFMLAFNKIDPDGRFQEQRKIKLDMPRNDWTMLQQRVALAWMRGRAGIPAQCANSARVYVNDEYYGLYTNAESQDKSFLKRVFGADGNDGDLWKGGRELKTNEDDFSWARITAMWDVTDLAGLDALTDVDESMREWASEAVIGDADGYNNGRANFYLYDHPGTGRFVWLANDLDTALDVDFLAPDTTPVLAPSPSHSARWERDWHHYLVAMNDPAGVARYVVAMSDQLPRLDPAELAQWIDDWSAQIAAAAAEDPHRPFELEDHTLALERMKDYPAARAEYLQRWLSCWDTGGADGDGDGFDLCHDCNDADPTQSPGAAEVCDAVDNDCDGRVDDVAEGCPAPATAARRAAWWRQVFRVKTSAR